jgi:hypothetical protein
MKHLCQVDDAMKTGGEGMVRVVHALLLAGLFFVCSQSEAHAYLDPGSGSVLTSAIIGFFAAIAYTLRKYFYKLRSFFGGRSATPAPDRKQP